MPNIPVLTDDDIKIAFNEEKENLNRIESSINQMIASERLKLNIAQKENSDYVVYDNEDLDRRRYIIEQINIQYRTVAELSSYIDSPYFGRFDMHCNGEKPKTYFVGKKGLGRGSDGIILDWRSPIGNTFYNKNSHHFRVDDTEYELLLRRAVEIRKASLISVNTEYDSANLSLEGEVIDEFLISVLKDKRRDYKLTDIIRTIQGNQNSIIGKPVDENFIVQGCAGSGKTMILLHRLSYIAFNYPNTNFSSYFILTPNENFNLHVDELSRTLGLNMIRRFTVEEFYADRINFLSKGDNYIKGGKVNQKIVASVEGLESEKLLNNDLLKKIYSGTFYTEITEAYNSKAAKAARQIEELNVIEVLKKYRHSVRSFSRMDFSSYSQLNSALRALIKNHTEASKQIKEAEDNLSVVIAKLKAAEDDYAEKEEAFSNARSVLIQESENQLAELAGQESSSKESLRKFKEGISSAKTEKAQLFEQIRRTESSLDIIANSPERLSNFNFLSSSDEEIAEVIKTCCKEEYSKIRDISAQIDVLAVYNFGKKARLRTELDVAEHELSNSAREIIKRYRDDRTVEVSEKRNRIATLDNTIESINSSIANLQIGIRSASARLDAYRAVKTCFDTQTAPDLDKLLNDTYKAIIGEDYNQYSRAKKESAEAKRNLEVQKSSEERLNSLVEKLRPHLIPDEDYSVLLIADGIVNEFDMKVLKMDLENRLKNLYLEYSQNYSSKKNYRHRLYLKLLLCALYYAQTNNSILNISIDEAQDLSVTEYRLLREVLGEKTVFNLYGDVNQSVYEYKGVSDWGEICDSIPFNLYFLNENYRNTVQITNFCNQKFEADVTAIGLNGSKVVRTDFSSALKSLNKLHKDKPLFRTAVIYRKGLALLETQIRAVLPSGVVFNRIDIESVSVITVEEAKGLEFDAVVVIDNCMTVNEQYVAYTRALDNLIITELSDATIEEYQDNPDVESIDVAEEPEDVEEELPIPIKDDTMPQANIDIKESYDEPEVLPELPEKYINVSLQDGIGYINAFFRKEKAMRECFIKLAEYVCGSDETIQLRVCREYIGLGRVDEKTRLYIAFNKDLYTIKFSHLYAKEFFDTAKLEQYKRAYDQCALSVKQYPITLKAR